MGPSSSFVEYHEVLDVFLHPFSFKQKAFCYVQESSGKYVRKEGSQVAKQRPMNLVSRNLPSAKKTLPQDSSASNSPGSQELDQSYVSPSLRKLMRNSNQDPASYSRERQQDDTQSSTHRKLGRSGESASAASTRKLERGEDIQIGRSRLEFHNV